METPLLDPIGGGKASLLENGNGHGYGTVTEGSSMAMMADGSRDEARDDLNDYGDFGPEGLPSPLSPPSQVALGKHPHQHRGASPLYEKEPKCSVRQTARRSSAEHLIATKALRCTAAAWILTVAQCSAIP